MADAEVPAKKPDLMVRTLSAVVMVTVTGIALWWGRGVWAVFVGLVAAGVLWEWSKLAAAFTTGLGARLLWQLGGLVYVGVACLSLLVLRAD